jgi:hypothetical protein
VSGNLTPEERRQRAGVTDEIIRADPRARKTALAIVLVGAVVGAAAIGWLGPALERWTPLSDEPLPSEIRLACWVFLGLVTLLALPVAAFGLYAIRIGRLVREAGRYPPQGMRLVRDTRVLVGPAARLMGKGQILIGAVLIVCSILLVLVSTYGVMRLLG